MTQVSQEHSVVAIYDSHDLAEAAIQALQREGLDMKRVSIVGRDIQTDDQALGFYTSGERMQFRETTALFGEASGECCLVARSSSFR